MSQLHGKQIRNGSTSLSKLDGTGLVTFTAATMSFSAGSILRTADTNIVDGLDVVNKNYVDSVASGLEVKESVRVISLSNITLSGYPTIDGITVSFGDRVLVNGQTDKKTNGIYVAATASWSRAEDMDEPSEINGGEFVFIREGNTYGDTGWVATLPDSQMPVIGNADIQFTQFSSAGIIEVGDGLEKIGNIISIKDTLAGGGLSYSNVTGIMDVNVNSDALEINGSDQVALKSTITGVRTFSDYLTANGGLDVNGGATVSGNTLLENNLSVTGNSSFTGLVTASGGVTASTGFFTTSLQTPNAPTTGNDVINLTYFGASYSQLQNQITNDVITEVIAGNGLVGGGTTGSVTLDVNTGLGLTLSNDAVQMVWGGTASGLTFSGNGVKVNVDGTTIIINGSGQLQVVGGSAQPVYQVSTGDVLTTGLTLASTPNAYSRLQVFINGLEESVQFAGVTNPAVNVSGTTLTWNASNAGYSIDAQDEVRVIYES